MNDYVDYHQVMQNDIEYPFLDDYYKRENENHGDKSMIKTYQRGDKVNAEVVTLDADECGNEYMTKVELQSMEEMESLDILDEVCRNYF